MPLFSINFNAKFANSTLFDFNSKVCATILFLISTKSAMVLLLKWVISSRLFSFKINLPVSIISLEMSQDLSSSVFSIVKSISNLVKVSSFPASEMIASTASAKRFSESRETSKVIGNPKSRAKARMTLWVNLSIVEISKEA